MMNIYRTSQKTDKFCFCIEKWRWNNTENMSKFHWYNWGNQGGLINAFLAKSLTHREHARVHTILRYYNRRIPV